MRAHPVRRGVSFRPLRALASQEDAVVRLYVDDVQTLTETVDRFGVSEGAVLRRSRIRRRR